jgi:putative tryptophan/tyrosine transport system substrate-binding protein
MNVIWTRKRLFLPGIERWLILFAGIGGLTLLGGCDAGEKVYHVGILSGVNTYLDAVDGFRAKMASCGFVEGQNIFYDIRTVNADPAAERRAAEQFVANRVDLIFAFPTNPAKEAISAAQGKNIPVIFAFATTEDTGLVRSIRDPGADLTGVRIPGADLAVKRLELMQEMVPSLKRLWITYDKNYPTSKGVLNALRRAASANGVTLVEVAVSKVEEIEADLKARSASGKVGMDAILIMPDLLSQSPRGFQAIRSFAAQHRIPVAGNATIQTGQGALFSYAPDIVETGDFAARLAAKMLHRPHSMPVITPEPQLFIDYRQAKTLGVSVNDGLLKMATRVLQ